MAAQASKQEASVRKYAFLLMDNFTLMAFSSLVEPLRMANHRLQKKHYSWRTLGATQEGVRSSCGLLVKPDCGLVEAARDETIIVVGGRLIREGTTQAILAWLRRESRRGMTMGAVCTGSYVLARAGLLDGRTATIHWDHRDSFIEEFPEVELKQSIFEIAPGRITASGGTAPTDLMLKLLAEEHGAELANSVADLMIHTSIRSDKDEQRLSIPTRIGVRHPKLSTVVQRMEENIEEPISPSQLASDVAMSTRQLERLFRRYLNRSPKRYYMELRLARARNLLMQTDMSVINVALACGFSSPSHFSKCYRSHFGTTPYRERGVQLAES